MLDFLKQLGKAVTDGMGLNVRSDTAPVGSAGGHTVIPDKPVPFGYKNSWLCVKAGSPEEVIEKIGLKNPRVSTWKDGVYGSGVFVSPVLDGYVLVVGWEGIYSIPIPGGSTSWRRNFPSCSFSALIVSRNITPGRSTLTESPCAFTALTAVTVCLSQTGVCPLPRRSSFTATISPLMTTLILKPTYSPMRSALCRSPPRGV